MYSPAPGCPRTAGERALPHCARHAASNPLTAGDVLEMAPLAQVLARATIATVRFQAAQRRAAIAAASKEAAE